MLRDTEVASGLNVAHGPPIGLGYCECKYIKLHLDFEMTNANTDMDSVFDLHFVKWTGLTMDQNEEEEGSLTLYL